MINKLKTNKKQIIYLALVVILVMLALFLIHNAGTYLVRKDQPVKGDAMLILMGSISDRVLEAADLYQAAMAPKLLIVEESMGPAKMLLSRGATLISNTRQCSNIATELGIPASVITIIPGEATSTKMEARLVCEYLLQNGGIDTLLIVTSPAHTRRAGLIFDNAFSKYGLKVTIITCPSKYGSYDGRSWYLNREEVQDVIFEYIKLFTFVTIERFRKP
jgi:uncharacterized SAM-binding protein YcdF (DUF218 family)